MTQVSRRCIEIDDPRRDDVRELLARHWTFAGLHSPREDMHALDVDGLLDASVTFFSCRANGELLAVGALKRLDSHHAELKSMHTTEAARRRGIGREMVEHLLALARDRGFGRVSIETGSQAAFAPARALYASAGFEPCGPFGPYVAGPNTAFMTRELTETPIPPAA